MTREEKKPESSGSSTSSYIGGTSGSGSNTGGGDSFWKSPILKKGEYDIWVHQMKIHVNSVDPSAGRSSPKETSCSSTTRVHLSLKISGTRLNTRRSRGITRP